MSPDYDFQIKSLFDEAKSAAPDEDFTRRVMLSIRRQERRAKMLWLAWLAVLVPFAWVAAPDLERLALSVNGFVEFAFGFVVASLAELSLSPATWIFLVPLVTYFLYRSRHRLN